MSGEKRGRDVKVGDVLARGFLVLGFEPREGDRRFALNAWGERRLVQDSRFYSVSGANGRSSAGSMNEPPRCVNTSTALTSSTEYAEREASVSILPRESDTHTDRRPSGR